MASTILIGYGNRERCDDGVAYHVIEAVRQRMRHRGTSAVGAGPATSRGGITAMFFPQLLPELAPELAAHDRLVFVDAHVDPGLGRINWRHLQPGGHFSPLTHHLSPEALMALCALYRRHPPVGDLLSVRGHVFGHGRHLSAETSALITEAALQVVGFIEGCPAAAAAGGHADPSSIIP
jgi:hydrogenase maturation protease